MLESWVHMIRLRMELALTDTLGVPDDGVSACTVRPTERDGLAELLFFAYEGGPDQEEDTVDEAQIEVDRTLDGGYGPFVPEASFLVRDEAGCVACTLVVIHKNVPLLAHALVHPRAQSRGFGTALIRRSAAALATSNHAALTLAVHPDSRARKVYERIGFVARALPST